MAYEEHMVSLYNTNNNHSFFAYFNKQYIEKH